MSVRSSRSASGPSTLAPFVLALWLLACQRSTPTPPLPRKAIALSFSATETLLSGPTHAEARTLMEEIAKQPAVAPSPPPNQKGSVEYQAFARLVQLVGENLPALLAHKSPIVRLSVARHLLQTDPTQIAAVSRLLFDQTPVRMRQGVNQGGFRGRGRDVGSALLDLACMLRKTPHVRTFLAEAVRNVDLGSFRADALVCLAREDPSAARTLALELFDGGQAVYLPASIATLRTLKDTSRHKNIETLAQHRDPKIRETVAEYIRDLNGDPAILRGMLKDPEPRVKAAALFRYHAQKEEVPLLLSLLKDGDPRVRGEAAGALARSGQNEVLGKLQAFLAADAGNIEALEPIGRIQSEISLELLRTIARERQEENWRMHALRHLVRAGDPKSQEIFEETLRSAILNERVLGADGLASLGVQSSVPRLMEMARRDPKPAGKLAALRALQRLGVKDLDGLYKEAGFNHH